jgi:ABC-type transporter Mla maintaining outer membrane lipid asymmetry ATPase subunit MlaF
MGNGAGPVIEIRDVSKNYQGLRPLRLRALSLGVDDRVALSGLDAMAAEVLVNLMTGATLPDEGEIRVFGASTREIATETEWLASLDRFGIVSHRAVLLEGLTVRQNLAMPFTLDIDPPAPAIRDRVDRLAGEAGIDRALLDVPVAGVDPRVRQRVHLARAVALDPAVLVLEHPTTGLPPDASGGIGRDVAAIARARRIAVLAISEDRTFARAAADRLLRLRPATGELMVARRWF